MSNVRVKDCDLLNQNMKIIILFACLVGWHKSSPVEIKKKIRYDLLKNIDSSGWRDYLRGHAQGLWPS